MTQKTAVLIFANSSAEEQMQKSILKGRAIFDVLNEKIINTVSKSGLPYYLFTEKEQQGNTFGSRFVNAIHQVFEKGFTHIITVGNDTPHLKTSHLLSAKQQLEANKFVLGPSTDGGFYLMGLEKSQFNRAAFLKLPWQSSKLYKSLESHIQKKPTEIVKLEVLNDLDSFKDLEVFRNCFQNIAAALKIIIVSIFKSNKKVLSFQHISRFNLQYKILHNKGSPVFFFPTL